jgi:hypothetical protein
MYSTTRPLMRMCSMIRAFPCSAFILPSAQLGPRQCSCTAGAMGTRFAAQGARADSPPASLARTRPDIDWNVPASDLESDALPLRSCWVAFGNATRIQTIRRCKQWVSCLRRVPSSGAQRSQHAAHDPTAAAFPKSIMGAQFYVQVARAAAGSIDRSQIVTSSPLRSRPRAVHLAQAMPANVPAAVHLCPDLVSICGHANALQCESGAGWWAMGSIVFVEPLQFGERRSAWDARSGEPAGTTSSFPFANGSV